MGLDRAFIPLTRAALELARCDLGALPRDEPFGVVRERQLTGLLRVGQGGRAAEGVFGGVQLVAACLGCLPGRVALLPRAHVPWYRQAVRVRRGLAPADLIAAYRLTLALGGRLVRSYVGHVTESLPARTRSAPYCAPTVRRRLA